MESLIKEDTKSGKSINPIATGNVQPKPQVFKARLRKEMLVADAQVRAAVKGNATLVDNRPSDIFVGIRKSPAAKVAGTIPGSQNIEQSWITIMAEAAFAAATSFPKFTRPLAFRSKEIKSSFVIPDIRLGACFALPLSVLGHARAMN